MKYIQIRLRNIMNEPNCTFMIEFLFEQKTGNESSIEKWSFLLHVKYDNMPLLV